MVQGEGFEPPKAQGRQIYSLLRLTASLPLHSYGWSPNRGLNSGPLPYHGSALPLSYLGEVYQERIPFFVSFFNLLKAGIALVKTSYIL